MNSRQWFFSGVAILLQIPMFTYAAGLVPCGGSGEEACQMCHTVQLINGVTAWLVGILSVVAAIMFVVAGFKLVASGGNPGAKEDAKNMITNVAIGFVIVLTAWLLIDLMMKSLLGSDSAGVGPWNVIQCVDQPQSGVTPGQLDVMVAEGTSIGMAGGGTLVREACDPTPGGNTNCAAQELACTDGGGTATVNTNDPANYYVSCTYTSTSYGGSCAVVSNPSNPCHESNLTMFGSRAAEASIVCNKESGGSPVRSGSDLCCGPGGNCSGAPSFSGGYFQINILAHADKIPNCTPGAFYSRNGTAGAQGDCVRRNGEGVCTGWSCSITNTAMYNACMRVTTNSALNFQIAEQLFNARGQRFNDWSWSARRCSIPY